MRIGMGFCFIVFIGPGMGRPWTADWIQDRNGAVLGVHAGPIVCYILFAPFYFFFAV